MLHHIMDDIIDFVGGYTVYVTFGNERCVYYITERHLWIHRLGIDIDAVAAYHIEPQICLCGHIAEFLLGDDVAPLLLIQINVIIPCCEVHTV